MSTKAKIPKKKKTPASIVWFEIPADKIDRAKAFYSTLFGWKIAPMNAAIPDYWHIDTGGSDSSLDGALMSRMHDRHTITNYVLVDSVTKSAAKVVKLGGKICKPKTTVPKMGHFVICRDTENNEFALWQMDPKAK